MSNFQASLEGEERPEEYDELIDGRFSTRDYLPSSPGHTETPAHLTIKRNVYPHWEERALKDQVVVSHNSRNENVCEKLEPNRTGPSGISRICATLLAAITAPAAGEPNSTPFLPQLYGASPNHPSPFTSFIPPHLPLATHFPPFGPRARVLGFSPRATQKVEPVRTFSFSRLQMIADAAASRWSPLQRLCGLHNQVQGSTHNPALWRSVSEKEGDLENDAKSARDDLHTNGYIADVDSSLASVKTNEKDALTLEGWPKMQDDELAALRPVELAFEDSFDSYLCSSVSDCSHDSILQQADPSHGLASGANCTCGHQKHYVRPLSETGDLEDHGSDQAQDNESERILADTMSAIHDYAESAMTSTRANASTESLNDSRTSSAVYLSSNFIPGSQYTIDDYFGAQNYSVPPPTAATAATEDGRDEGSSTDGHDGHRVYFPTSSTAPSTPRPAGSGLRSLFMVALRRASTLTNRVRYMRRPSGPAATFAETILESNTIPNATHPAPAPQSEGVRLLPVLEHDASFATRGRSMTLRPLGTRSPPSNAQRENGRLDGYGIQSNTSGDLLRRQSPQRRSSVAGISFIRRLSMGLGHSNPDTNTNFNSNPNDSTIPSTSGMRAPIDVPQVSTTSVSATLSKPQTALPATTPTRTTSTPVPVTAPAVPSEPQPQQTQETPQQLSGAFRFRHFKLSGLNRAGANRR